MRPIPWAGKRMCAGIDEGGERWACLASLIETRTRNGINPQTYLTELFTRIVNGCPQASIDELMRWQDSTAPPQ
jgi:transposase